MFGLSLSALNLLVLSSPASLSFVLLFGALFLAYILGFILSNWFCFTFFLLYAGAFLVLLIYFCMFSSNFKGVSFSFAWFLSFVPFMKVKEFLFFSSFLDSSLGTWLINPSCSSLFVGLASFLLICFLSVVSVVLLVCFWGFWKPLLGDFLPSLLLSFFDWVNSFCVLIFCFVAYMGASVIFSKMSNRTLVEMPTLELIWTVLPGMILLFIALPSLRLLYLLDSGGSGIVLKSIGYQWYWSYELGDSKLDSYMTPTEDLTSGMFRLLDVDNRVTVPHSSPINVVVTSGDVLHSWALPPLSLKVDAVPGRLNTISTSFLPGVYYGQCSEICGANHSFMPICVQAN